MSEPGSVTLSLRKNVSIYGVVLSWTYITRLLESRYSCKLSNRIATIGRSSNEREISYSTSGCLSKYDNIFSASIY